MVTNLLGVSVVHANFNSLGTVLPAPAQDLRIMVEQFSSVISSRPSSKPKPVVIIDDIENMASKDLSFLSERLLELYVKNQLSVLYIVAEAPNTLVEGKTILCI